MARFLDKQAVQPRRRRNLSNAIRVPRNPARVELAAIRLTIPANAQLNRVELVATVGVRGVKGIAQVLFRVFRGNVEIFSIRQGIEPAGSELNYAVTFQAIDTNVSRGTHRYTVTAENRTANTTVHVVGPISFSGLAAQTNT